MDRLLSVKKISCLGNIIRERAKALKTIPAVITEAMNMILDTS